MRKMRRFLLLTGKLCVVLLVLGILIIGYKNYQDLKKVHSYEQEITTAVEKYDISEYKELAMSIMLTESKGKGTDPMQSSESLSGEQNQFDDPKESIDQGVAYLSEMLRLADEKGCDIWTAVQAYNFGVDYINYVEKYGKKNTVELAENYSKEVLSPQLGNDSKKTYRYWGVQSLMYNGGYLYHNGGNMFYAEIVKLNKLKVHYTTYFF